MSKRLTTVNMPAVRSNDNVWRPKYSSTLDIYTATNTGSSVLDAFRCMRHYKVVWLSHSRLRRFISWVRRSQLPAYRMEVDVCMLNAPKELLKGLLSEDDVLGVPTVDEYVDKMIYILNKQSSTP